MAGENGLALFYSLFGHSDEESDTPFEGYTLQEIRKGEESDIDLSVVVRQQNFEEFSSSYPSLKCFL